MEVQLLGLVLLICVGAVALVVRPLPTWPLPFEPHANSAPSARIAAECSVPAATATQVEVPIWVGTCRSVRPPLPSWPLALPPQAHSVPSARRASVWVAPAAAEL